MCFVVCRVPLCLPTVWFVVCQVPLCLPTVWFVVCRVPLCLPTVWFVVCRVPLCLPTVWFVVCRVPLCLPTALRRVVAWSSLAQSAKGILTAGPIKSLRYAAQKMGKMLRVS